MANIDTSWIEELESENKFFMEKISRIEVISIYLTEGKEMQSIKRDILELDTPAVITTEELVNAIQERKTNLGNSRYTLKDIRLYNISNTKGSLSELTPHSMFKDIILKDCISYFKDLNCLLLLFSDKLDKSHNTTKRLSLPNSKRKTRRSTANKTT
jgi:hypothetical protein